MQGMPATTKSRGRPAKYGRPARPVTLRLPEDTIAKLAAIDADLGRAIVSLASTRGRTLRAAAPVERTPYGRRSIIVVSPVTALARLAGVHLIPFGEGRALITLDRSRAIPQLELDLRDAIERGDLSRQEQSAFELLVEILRRARRSSRVTLEERKIIVIEPAG